MPSPAGAPPKRKNPAVTVLLLCAGALLLVSLLAALALVAFLRVDVPDPALADSIARTTRERIAGRERNFSSDNGYMLLEPLLKKSASKRTEPLAVLSRYCVGATPAEMRKALAGGGEEAETAIAAFDSVMPVVKDALGRTRFLYPPRTDDRADATIPHIVALRSIASSLAVRGVRYEMDGRPLDALRCYLAAIELGARLGKQGALIDQMVAIAIQKIGEEPLLWLLAAKTLPSHGYREALTRLAALPFADRDFLDSMDEEYTGVLTSIDLFSRGKSGAHPALSATLSPLLRALGGRERTLFQAWYLRRRPYFESLRHPSEDGITVETDREEMKRRVAILAGIFVPNVHKALGHFLAVRTEYSALKAVAALEAYRADRGAYPDSLDALVPRYLAEQPKDYCSGDRRFAYARAGNTFTLTSRSALYEEMKFRNPLRLHPPEPLRRDR